MEEKLIKSNQEQAVAAWINHLNQIRLNDLQDKLNDIAKELEDGLITQDQYFDNAVSELDKYLSIIRNNLDRGGSKGVHGFIAEAAQTGVGNARRLIQGLKENHVLVDDNGQWDLKINDVPVQMKFSAHTVDHMSLEACLDHLRHYPDSFEQGGKYMIPKDHFEKMKWLSGITEEQANKMGTDTGEFNLKEWRYVRDFIAKNDIPQSEIIPSDLTYAEVQKGRFEETFAREITSIAEKNNVIKKELNHDADAKARNAQNEAKPTVGEGVKATAVSALIEGATTFCSDVIKKHREKGSFKEFNQDDWEQIAVANAVGTAKGAVRGASIYTLTNYTATPGAVASSIVTASFGMAEQINKFRAGEIGESELIFNSEVVCLDASVSAASSLIGQAVIPVPVIGAVIGNTVGTMMYQIAKDNFSKKEQEIINSYLKHLEEQNKDLEEKYLDCIIKLNRDMGIYLSILPKAFSIDVEKALYGSIELAKWAGVPADEILDTDEKAYAYFVGNNDTKEKEKTA